MTHRAQLDEQHRFRADELVKLGWNTLADRVQRCGQMAFYHGHPMHPSCKSRLCPSCSQRTARKNADRVEAAICRFRHPVLLLVTMPPMGNLKEACRRFRQALARLRRLAWFRRMVRGGIVAIETKGPINGRWEVHGHLILDVDGLNVAEAAQAWGRYTTIPGTNWNGTFKLHDDPKVDLNRIRNLAIYVTKPDTWCPTPSSDLSPESLSRLDQLIESLRHQRLITAWGAGLGRPSADDKSAARESGAGQPCSVSVPSVPSSATPLTPAA